MLQGQAHTQEYMGTTNWIHVLLGKKNRVQEGMEVAWTWEERGGEVKENMIKIYEILKELKTSYLFIFVF